MLYIITELIEQRYHLYVGLRSVGMECALQMLDFPTWCEKALFNLMNTSLGEMFVISVPFLPCVLEISCFLVESKISESDITS